MVRVIFIISFLLISNKVFSQACCSGGTPLSAQMGMQFLEKNTVLFSLAYDYNFLNKEFSGSKETGINNRSRISQTLLFRVQWAFSKKWSIAAAIPYVWRNETNATQFDNFNNLHAQGISDLFTQLNFTLLSTNKNGLLFSGALKFPTGSNSEVNDLGLDLPADMQPGTGSLDYAFGALYQLSHILGGNSYFNASTTIRINGSGTRFDGKQTFKFGNEFQLITGLSTEIIFKKSNLVPALTVQYRRTYRDLTNDAITPGTGGDWINLIPAVSYEYNEVIQLLISYSIPIYRYLEETQLTTSYDVFVQLQYKLKPKNYEIPNF
jgi:hypothetical protein